MRSGRGHAFAFAALLALVVPLVIAPLLVIVAQAVLAPGFQPTVAPFAAVLGDGQYWLSLLNTVLVSLGATAFAGAFGIPLAWAFARSDLPGRRWLEGVAQIPIFIPPFVGAVAWILLGAPRIGFANIAMRWLGMPEWINVYTGMGMAWVMGIYLAPYVILIVAGALRSMDPSLEEAAQISGLSSWRTALQITLPLVGPAVLSSAVLAFSIAIGLFGTPVVLGWSRQILVLTTRIWIAAQAVPQDFGIMAVLAIYLMALSSLALALQQRVLRGRSFVTVTGKGFRPGVVRLGRAQGAWYAFALGYVLITIIAPIAVLIGASLSTYTWSGRFTWSILAGIAGSDDVWFTLRNSVVISIASATLATILGTAVAWVSNRTTMRGRKLLEYLVLLPLSVPGIAFGVGVMLLWLRVPVPVYGTAAVIIVAFVGRFSAYSVRSVGSSIVQVHTELEESARVAGYGWFRTGLRITLPLVSPGIAAGWVLLFSFFITELSMVVLLYTTDSRTFSVLSFEVWDNGYFSQLAGLSLLQLAVGMFVVLIARAALPGRLLINPRW